MDITKPQPPPQHNDSPAVWPLIIADLERGGLIDPQSPKGVAEVLVAAARARDAFGREKYGTPLQVENGRAPLVDAAQEALDLMVYTRQHFERVRSAEPLRKGAVLRAWQVHLAACAVAALVLVEEKESRTP